MDTLKSLITEFLYLSDPNNQKKLNTKQAAENGVKMSEDFRNILFLLGDFDSKGFSYTGTAGENISGGKVVHIKDGKIYHFDPSDESLYGAAIGISNTSADVGTSVTITVTGNFVEVGLGLIPDTDYYAGAGGILITDPTGLKVTQLVGRSVDSNTIFINLQLPIITI